MIVTAPELTVAEAAALAERIRALSAPVGAPKGFEQFSLAAWVAGFVDLIPGGAR